ncbi:hypothetical protein KC357_g4197 [Hortaea werneckii]|nr:hypothetical protein KC357_g4197 [Hortaea werneckii]
MDHHHHHHHHHRLHCQQQQQQQHADSAVALDSGLWLEDDEQYDHEPVTISFAAACLGPQPIPSFTAADVWRSGKNIDKTASAGAASGAVITALSCPFELTKLNEQLAGKIAREAQSKSGSSPKGPGQNPSPIVDVKSSGSWNTARRRRLVCDRGVLGLYAGYRLHLLRDTIGTAIYFTTYESAKQLMANSRGKTAPTAVVRSCLLNMIFFSNFEKIGLAGSWWTPVTLPLPSFTTILSSSGR